MFARLPQGVVDDRLVCGRIDEAAALKLTDVHPVANDLPDRPGPPADSPSSGPHARSGCLQARAGSPRSLAGARSRRPSGLCRNPAPAYRLVDERSRLVDTAPCIHRAVPLARVLYSTASAPCRAPLGNESMMRRTSCPVSVPRSKLSSTATNVPPADRILSMAARPSTNERQSGLSFATTTPSVSFDSIRAIASISSGRSARAPDS